MVKNEVRDAQNVVKKSLRNCADLFLLFTQILPNRTV
jgi:hypothetical protein